MAYQFPTSKDITFEVNSKSVAVVQSYTTSFTRDDKEVDSFGEPEAVGFTYGKKHYTLKITKAYINDAGLADGLDFYNLANFDFVIIKPDKKIVYSGCSITGIDEDGNLNDIIAEHINIRATSRAEQAITA